MSVPALRRRYFYAVLSRRVTAIELLMQFKSGHLPRVILLRQVTPAPPVVRLIAADPIGGSAVSQVTRSVPDANASDAGYERFASTAFA
jgi:hypothetical protein